MGCGLHKLKPLSDESSPGKIYSTLKRPQVETKVGVAYTYRYLDFLIGKDGGTSTLRLSSVRELPGQLHELYQQGFVLAAVHPFIHPCGPESNSPQHQLYRAILVRLNDGVERSQQRLQLEECLSADQVPTPELIQGYVKKQIQDAADQGVTFIGFVQEPYGAPCTRIREPETPSLSLHSSPSSVLGSLGSCSPPEPSSPRNHIGGEPGVRCEASDPVDKASAGKAQRDWTGEEPTGNTGNDGGTPPDLDTPSPDLEPTEGSREKELLIHNNNRTNAAETTGRTGYLRARRGDGVELLALFNHPPTREGQAKYYTVKVPLRVQNRDEGVKGVEANWLDHMTQHFNNGASLVDGYFHLGSENDLLPTSVESVFIFQEATESEPSAPAYDAIVVEQWTVIDGLQVKADYVPLLQSLATCGWRLTCVLPTPVIKTKSDGSLSTKQIVFLQRPVLTRKRRQSKKLIFKSRSKSNKNCIKEAAKNKKKKNKTTAEKDPEDVELLRRKERSGEDEANATEDGGQHDEATHGGEVKVEDGGKTSEGDVKGVEEERGEDGGDEGGNEERRQARPREREEDVGEDGGKLENGEEAAVVVETTGGPEKGGVAGEQQRVVAVEVLVQNGLEEEDEKEEGEENTTKPLESKDEVVPTNQSPEESQ